MHYDASFAMLLWKYQVLCLYVDALVKGAFVVTPSFKSKDAYARTCHANHLNLCIFYPFNQYIALFCMLLHNLKIPPPMSRLDFLIPTFSGPLFTVLACGFPILHHSVVDQVICLEDQNLPRIAKHFPSMKAPAKFLSFLEGTHQSGKYLL